PSELEGSIERKARQLARELKLPGFRRGKVPAPLVIQRIGREAVLEQAVRDGLSRWYSDALETAGIVPVGDPQLALGALPGGGEGGEQRLELGGGNRLAGFEEGLLGARAGDVRAVEVSFPQDYSSAELAGRRATLEVTVKEVKAKQLPEPDEDFAIDAGFDSL